MRRLALILLVLSACTHRKPDPPGIILARSAGVRFPAQPKVLGHQLDALLDKAGMPAPGAVLAVVVPNAALTYSGVAEAAALAPLRDRRFRRILLLAPGEPQTDIDWLPKAQALRTPLGDMPIDPGAVKLLMKSKHFRRSDVPFRGDHAVDAPLPMIQRAVGNVPFVPIIVGRLDAAGARQLAKVLQPLVETGTLVVVSTNLTAYGKRFKNTLFGNERGKALRARIAQADTILLKPFLAGDLDQFDQLARKTRANYSGIDAMRVLLALLPPGAQISLRRYDNSFDHDETAQVNEVSYAGMVVTGRWPDLAPLPAADRKALLAAARAALVAAVKHTSPPAPPLGSPLLLEKHGLFVTLTKDGHQRASVGQVESDAPLGRAVVEVAGDAASKDPRYPPLRPAELGQVKIELQILGPPRPVAKPIQFDPRRQGLLLQAPGHTAVLLPDPRAVVTTAQSLARLAQKADLPRAKWPAGGLRCFSVERVAEPGAEPAQEPRAPSSKPRTPGTARGDGGP